LFWFFHEVGPAKSFLLGIIIILCEMGVANSFHLLFQLLTEIAFG
jgi:hypothetical protein